MRRLIAVSFLAAGPVLGQAEAPKQQPASTSQPQDQTKFILPPGPATTEDTALLARAKDALESKKADVSAVLVDPAFMSIHARTEFRELIAARATAKRLTISGPKEPGTRLTVNFEFVDGAGKPVEGAQLYVYHTSAKGWYSDKAAHIQANSGDTKHARLFGYAVTDEKGHVELRTIRPAGYPNTDLPQHIHLHLKVGGKEVLVSEVRFDDDPRLTAEHRKRSEGDVIVKVEKDGEGERCKAVFKVK